MLDQALDFVSGLTWLTVPLGVAGFFLTIYLMALMGHEHEDWRDPVWVQWSRRLSYAVIALGMIWSIKFQLERGWHPWPPEIALMLGVMIMMGLKVVVIHLRIRRYGRRRPADNRQSMLSRSKR